MSRRRSSIRTSSSSYRPDRSRSARSGSRNVRRPNLEEMTTMLFDSYETAAARADVRHYQPPVRDIYAYEHDPDRPRPGAQVTRMKSKLKRNAKLWKEFLELHPDTLRDDPNLSRDEERARRLTLMMSRRNRN